MDESTKLTWIINDLYGGVSSDIIRFTEDNQARITEDGLYYRVVE